jgi:hypothetical protein
MTRRLIGVALAALAALALASVAIADHRGAKVYRATLAKTAAADTAQLPDVRGKALLVDTKKNNKVRVHVRGLKPGETYPWHVHKAKNATDDPCVPGSPAADPTPYGDWTYTALTANEAGGASAKGRSATFDSRADPGPFYVNVHLANGTVIACGVLETRKKKHFPSGRPEAPPKSERGQAQGHGPKPGKGPGSARG